MNEIRLLDCTLRDGGYVNDWEFGHSTITSIFERVVDSGAEIIEIGFLDDRRPFDINRTIMPDTKSVQDIFGHCVKRPPMVVGMIDYGTCKLENIQPCEESYLDGIRVIFKKHIMHEAMEYCAQLKKLGYKVFSQLVSITSYSDEEMMELIGLVNEIEPFAVSMVDTYGLLDPNYMLHYYEILDDNVKPSVQIGFHSHNNFQLAYANDLAFLHKERKHDIVVDATLFGMGKSAGNAPMELVAMYMNEHFDKEYKINPMLEAIEESVMDFLEISPWGYKMFYYLSAANKCHPSYVSYFLKKDNLSISQMNNLLSQVEPEVKKLMYDQKVAEQSYADYLANCTDDESMAAELGKRLKDRNVLIIGPGKNIQLQSIKVHDYIKNENPIVISINYIPGAFDVDYVFTTNRKRYEQMADALHEVKNRNVKIIATSNIDCVNNAPEFSFNREPLLEKNEEIKDNSFLMLLKVLNRAGVLNVACAGLDGYSNKEDNYYNPSMEYSFVKNAAYYLNNHIKNVLLDFSNININFVTYSHYLDQEDSNDAAF